MFRGLFAGLHPEALNAVIEAWICGPPRAVVKGSRVIVLDGKTNLGVRQLGVFDLAGTAEAMHCQDDTARTITGASTDFISTVKSKYPKSRAALKALLWADVPGRSPAEWIRGRRVRRIIKTIQVLTWMVFPRAR
ncbi:hypothetical protein KEM60_01105 [Austwickia sp. TVS 96-490-7B]|nr:hypothetical protein [Austwickia sp. TVS 96-490-7B]